MYKVFADRRVNCGIAIPVRQVIVSASYYLLFEVENEYTKYFQALPLCTNDVLKFTLYGK